MESWRLPGAVSWAQQTPAAAQLGMLQALTVPLRVPAAAPPTPHWHWVLSASLTVRAGNTSSLCLPGAGIPPIPSSQYQGGGNSIPTSQRLWHKTPKS